MSDRIEFTPRGRKADAIDREWAAALAERVGLLRAAKAVGVSRAALANVIAGLNVVPTTVAAIREARTRASEHTAA